MSIQTEINRLKTAKTNILASLENKGVDTSSVTTLDDVAPLVDGISTSEDLTNEFNDYEAYLNTQETTIENIFSSLENKSFGSGTEDLTNEFNDYEAYLNTQEDIINAIITSLEKFR